MEEKTRKVIMSIKKRDSGVTRDEAVIKALSEYTGNKKELYESSVVLTNQAKECFVDFLKTADNPAAIVESVFSYADFGLVPVYNEEGLSFDDRLREAIWRTFDFVQVTKGDGHYINGFVSYKLTPLEYKYLALYEEKFPYFKYIARDEDGSLNIYQVLSKNQALEKHTRIRDGYYKRQPIIFKNMFKFISFKDKQPYKIDDILNYCEIVDS